MSNYLIISCMAFATNSFGFTARDDYANTYQADWENEAAFVQRFPNEASLIEHVASLDIMGFEGTHDDDNQYGIGIESVSEIEVENFPEKGEQGLGANTIGKPEPAGVYHSPLKP